MVRIRLFIDSVDRSSLLLDPPEGGWEIEQKAGGSPDTFKFTLLDRSNSLSLVGAKEVIAENFADSTDRLFGGILTEINDASDGLGLRYDCVALGWQFDLERSTVTEIFQSKSDQFIITDTIGLFGTASEKDLSAYTVTSATVKEGIANTEKIVLQGDTVVSVMDMLTDWAIGFVWGVTPKQVVYYRPWGESVHSFSLSDVPDDVTKFGYSRIQRFRDYSGLVNAIKVFGGRHREENQTKTFLGDGTITLFTLVLDWRKKDGATDDRLQVDKNTGSDMSPSWTAQTVGLPQETGSFDVIWDELAKSLEFTSAPANLKAAFRVTGDIWRPLIGEAVDQASIDTHGRFEISIKDVSLTDDEAVERRGDVELNRRSQDLERLVLTTTKDGIVAGDLITLVNATRSIDALYLVTKLLTLPLGGNQLRYDVTLAKVIV